MTGRTARPYASALGTRVRRRVHCGVNPGGGGRPPPPPPPPGPRRLPPPPRAAVSRRRSLATSITAALRTKILERLFQAAKCFLSQDDPERPLVPTDFGFARTYLQGHVGVAGVHRDLVLVVVDRDLYEVGHASELPVSEADDPLGRSRCSRPALDTRPARCQT